MTVIHRVLTIATVFAGSSILIAVFLTRAGGGLTRESEIPVQELWLKMGGGLIRKGGVLAGYYSTCATQVSPPYNVH